MSMGSDWFYFGSSQCHEPFGHCRDLKLPEIGPLQKQLNAFYEMNKLTVAPEHVLREAWGIKTACGFVKRKGRRGEVTKDP